MTTHHHDQLHPRHPQRPYQGHRPSQSSSPQSRLLLTALLLLSAAMAQVQAQEPTQGNVPPSPPLTDSTYYYVGCYTARTDLLKETVYAKAPQTCLEICEHQVYNYAILSSERCFCSNTANEAERQDELLCNTRCLANKSQYCGGVGVHSYYSTRLPQEPAPRQLRLANASEHSLTVAWEPLRPHKLFIAGAEAASAQQISHFLIKSRVVRSFSSLPFFPQPEFIVQHTETRFELTDLHPATEYNVSVAAICEQEVCGEAALLATTEVGLPSPSPPEPRIIKSTDATTTLEVPLIRNDNGPVTKVLILVERVDEALSQPFDTELLGDWRKAQDDGLPYYIAAELDYGLLAENRTIKFVVGDGKRYGPFENVPLNNKEAHIHVSLGVVSVLNGVEKTIYTRSTHDQHHSSMDDFTYATFDSGRDSIVALATTCVIFGTCLVLSLVAYFYLRYKACQTRSGASRLRNTHELTMQQPIMERENNGFVVEDELPFVNNFRQQLDTLLQTLDPVKRLPRTALRMNVNDVIAEGRYGEVITGKLIATPSPPEASSGDCQLHVLALDELSGENQAHLLHEIRSLFRLQRHDHILDFHGVSASADWFYLVFEQQTVSLKRRLIESRRAPNSSPVQRVSSLSEELVLQWIYELASALEHLGRARVVHKRLSSHSVFVTAEAKLKLALFGPTPFASNRKQVDVTRWQAPESLRHQHYSTKSDVWAFACVAWECCSLGGTPYANVASSQLVLDAIKSGSRPAQPAFVFHDLYQLLMNCWQLEPSDRTTFEDIAFNVRQLMTSPRHALTFDRAPETPGNNVLDTLPYYLPMLEMIN